MIALLIGSIIGVALAYIFLRSRVKSSLEKWGAKLKEEFKGEAGRETFYRALKSKYLQVVVFSAISLIIVFHVVSNFSNMMNLLPLRDFVIFLELFSLLIGLYLASSYFSYKGISRSFRAVLLSLTLISFSLLSFFNPYWLLMVVVLAVSFISLYKEEKSESIWSSKFSHLIVILFLLPLVTSLIFLSIPVDVGTTEEDFRVAFKLEGIPPLRERVSAPLSIGRPVQLYSENIINENEIEILKKYEAPISLGIHENYLYDNSPAEKIVRKLNRENVPVYAWLLAGKENLYWANDLNYRSFNRLYERFDNWRDNLRFESVVWTKSLTLESKEIQF